MDIKNVDKFISIIIVFLFFWYNTIHTTTHIHKRWNDVNTKIIPRNNIDDAIIILIVLVIL